MNKDIACLCLVIVAPPGVLSTGVGMETILVIVVLSY